VEEEVCAGVDRAAGRAAADPVLFSSLATTKRTEGETSFAKSGPSKSMMVLAGVKGTR
jgi:hypothetical protein